MLFSTWLDATGIAAQRGPKTIDSGAHADDADLSLSEVGGTVNPAVLRLVQPTNDT